ncbi:MAG TPA: hypothetical protein VFP44_15995 [Usitatibacter sp.]|nr:hypothetical protein [Usitatibacter sp.]
MNTRTWLRLCGLLLLAISTASWSTTTTISPGANLTAAIEAATDGDTILLNPGTYTPANTGSYPFTGSFGVGKRVFIRGLGATPAGVVLQGASPPGGFAVHYLKYQIGPSFGNPSGGSLENLTIASAPGGIRIHDFVNNTRLSDITVRNVVINTTDAGGGFGILMQNDDRIVIDGVTITSYNSGIDMIDTSDSLIMNSTVTGTVAGNAPGLAVQGGNTNRFVGNTFGTPKANPAVDSGYSFGAGGVVFYNTKANRFENNVVQGFADDGLDFTATDLTGVLPSAQATTNSTDNYVGKNTVIATGFAAGRPGGSGIWSNCGSQNTWLFANDSSGSVEGGVTVWSSNSNLALGNSTHGHGTVGVFVSGGNEVVPFCTVAGGAYAGKPANNYVRNNAAFFNRAEQIIIRSADNTDVSMNFASPRSSRTGVLQPAADPTNGQSALTFGTDSRFANSTGLRIAANTSSENPRGFWDDDNRNDTGIETYLNRIIGSSLNRVTTSAPLNLDGGPSVGGNYWSGFAAAGNPSTGSTPFTNISHDSFNNFGLVSDRFPYQREDLGRLNAVQVFEPRAGSYAIGTRRTVRWYAPGCVYADIWLDASVQLATDVPNTGYSVVTMPSVATGAHSVTVTCKNSAGVVTGQANSPAFTLTNSTLQIVSPGRDDVFNAGSQIFVAWKKTSAIAGVDVRLSTDGGATFPTILASGVTGTFARVTLPNIASVQAARIMVQASTTTSDTNDGVFAIRGASGAAFTNVAAGRVFVMGGLERIVWSSPQNSRLVTITANGTPIATNLPDRGWFDWIPKDLGATGVTLGITFKDTTGASILGTATSASGFLRYATTITFGPLSAIAPGTSRAIGATTNSGMAVSLTSLTPSVCTASGTTVTGVAAGTCTVSATAAGNATFAAALPVSVSLTIGAGAVTDPPRLSGISTRMGVLTGDNVMIAGFIVGGSVPKTVVVRARGPSLGVAGALADPTLTLVPASGTPITNDNWGSAANAAQLSSIGFAPGDPNESAIMATLAPGAYTAIASGVGGSTGVAIVEVYEIDHPESPMTGISTRGFVQTGDSVMIGGFIISGSGPQTVVVRARGPSLGVAGALQDPVLTLVPASGTTVVNDNWQTASNSAQLASSGFAPSDSREAAILVTLSPGAYTAIVSGAGGTTGVAIVEVFGQ